MFSNVSICITLKNFNEITFNEFIDDLNNEATSNGDTLGFYDFYGGKWYVFP